MFRYHNDPDLQCSNGSVTRLFKASSVVYIHRLHELRTM